MDSHDYSAAANVWQRVNPQETPYPEAGRGRFEGGMVPTPPQQMPNRPTMPPQQPMQPSMPPAVRPMPMPPGNNGDRQTVYRALLREEMRHMQQVLSMLENALA